MLRPERHLKDHDDETIIFYHIGLDGYHGRRILKRGEPPPPDEPWLCEIPLPVGDELPPAVTGGDQHDRRSD